MAKQKEKGKETEGQTDAAAGQAENNQDTSLSAELEHWRGSAHQWKDAYDAVCAQLARIHAAAVGEVTGPKRGVVEDVEDVINGLRARVAELESNAAVERCDVGSTSSGDDKDLAVKAYNLYVKGQADGEYHAWSELDPPTQKLWRDGYNHVAGGGKPRTDYEQAVRYLILSAQ
jgi:hypothetical protein